MDYHIVPSTACCTSSQRYVRLLFISFNDAFRQRNGREWKKIKLHLNATLRIKKERVDFLRITIFIFVLK